MEACWTGEVYDINATELGYALSVETAYGYLILLILLTVDCIILSAGHVPNGSIISLVSGCVRSTNTGTPTGARTRKGTKYV